MLDADATIALLAEQPVRTAILVDFDGSLAPIVDHPDDATALPAAVDALGRLVPVVGRVAVVSGRPVAFLREQVPLEGVSLAGLYGLETVTDGVRRVDPRVEPFLGRVEAAAVEAAARLPGILVERKAGICVTLHWRMDPDRADEVRAVASELAVRHGLDAPQRGRMAVELRPPVPVDKGTAVDVLLDGVRVGAFAGDDLGDMPAFAALGRAVEDGRLDHAVRIGVLSSEAPVELRDAVDTVVDGPSGLVDLLDQLAQRVGRL